MFLINWYRQWLELKAEYKVEKPCDSCETLRQQNEFLRQDNDRLLTRILTPAVVLERPEAIPDNVTPLRKGHIPWNVRRQSLEAEDRQKAKLQRDAPKAVASDTSTEELEKEVLNAEQERESQTGR